jgi:acetylornithine aminotransferase
VAGRRRARPRPQRRRPDRAVRARRGSSLWDADGRRYLDFLGGIAVTSLGHAHPVFVEAVSRQAATLAHVSNFFATPPQLALAATLKRLAGAGDRTRVLRQLGRRGERGRVQARPPARRGDGRAARPASSR